MKVSTEIDNNFGYEKITQLVDNIPLICQQRYTIHGNMMFTYKHTAEGITKFCKQNKRIYA
jgi:hypothetical protein